MKKRVLVVAPHPDDESLGAGGTIAKFSQQGHEVAVLVVSGHLPPLYRREDYETTVEEARKAFAVLGVKSNRFLEIPATMVAQQPVHVVNSAVTIMLVGSLGLMIFGFLVSLRFRLNRDTHTVLMDEIERFKKQPGTALVESHAETPTSDAESLAR